MWQNSHESEKYLEMSVPKKVIHSMILAMNKSEQMTNIGW